LADAEQAWAEEAPASYDAMYDVAPPVEQWNGDDLTITRTLACDDPGTFGPLTSPPLEPEHDENVGMYGLATMDILVGAAYRVELTAARGGRVGLRRRGCWDEAEDSVGLAIELEANDAQEIVLSGCRWLVVFSSDDVDQALTMSLHLTRVGS